MSVLLWSTIANARQPDGAELQRAVERLGVVGRVLYVAAHPDDENTRLLAWLVHARGLSATYLSLTRGEGGQNLIGAEQGPLLGVIRTAELMAARGLDGAQQWFGLERDFGYSKNPEETLRIWGHDAALGDVVWAIRKLQPDVIVTRFSPEVRDTHGHHTASAMLAVEAFRDAADPKAYPEQLKWVKPWQARRIVWNKGVWPGSHDDVSGFLQLDVGGYDPILGASYGEVAARSRSMHKSQGFGAAPQRGPAPEYFKLLAGEPMQKSFLDGIDFSWHRAPGSEKLIAALERARASFRPAQPADAIAPLLDALEALEAMPENPWRAEKRAAIVDAIAGCAGLYAEAVADDFVATPGGERKVTVRILNRSTAPLTLREVRVGGATVAVGKPLGANQPLEVQASAPVPAARPPARPTGSSTSRRAGAGRWPTRR
jgi:LmbE family N-acetylglucosaminyl deacetylase